MAVLTAAPVTQAIGGADVDIALRATGTGRA